jgi:phenylacetate-CoA ligase
VFETYGCREFMLIAAECECRQGLHLTAEHLWVEILDDAGNPAPAGEEGNVVVTDLFNYGMPFIRYATGDRAVASPEPCRCGRGLPLLSKIVGRQLDVIRTPDGRLIPGEFFPHLIKDFPAVRRFQVVQEEPDRAVLRVVADGMAPEAHRKLYDTVRQRLGPAMRFDIEPVEQIPLTAAGKLQVVVSHVPQRKAG